jgi:hypothetical protein
MTPTRKAACLLLAVLSFFLFNYSHGIAAHGTEAA